MMKQAYAISMITSVLKFFFGRMTKIVTGISKSIVGMLSTGNTAELALGVAIGTAFNMILTSFTADLFTPVMRACPPFTLSGWDIYCVAGCQGLVLVAGQRYTANATWVGPDQYASIEEALEDGAMVINVRGDVALTPRPRMP